MPVKLGKGRKNEMCIFQNTKLDDTHQKINIPYFERFDPSHMYYSSSTSMVGELKTDSEMRDEAHLNNGNTQYSLVLSYVHFLSNCVKKEILDSEHRGTVVLFGFNSGDHIPFIMEMFPMLDYIFVDDKSSYEKFTSVMVKSFDEPDVESAAAGYFHKRSVEKYHDFFGKRYDTRYRFVSITDFMTELAEINDESIRPLQRKCGPFEKFENIKYPSSEIKPKSIAELVADKKNGHGLYLISNYRSGDHNAREDGNDIILSDLINQLYWMKAMRPTYSFVRYKAPNVSKGVITNDTKSKLLLLTNGGEVGFFCDYPRGFLFKIPKTSKLLNSAFLMTNEYDKTIRIYNENFRTLLNYHNRYTKQTIVYEDIFLRLIDDKMIGIPYSSLKIDMINKIIQDYDIRAVDDRLHEFYITNSWDDTVSVYIIMCYMKLFDKTIDLRSDTKMRNLGMPVPDSTKKVVKMNQVLKTIVHSLLILRYKENSYDKVVNTFLLSKIPEKKHYNTVM